MRFLAVATYCVSMYVVFSEAFTKVPTEGWPEKANRVFGARSLGTHWTELPSSSESCFPS